MTIFVRPVACFAMKHASAVDRRPVVARRVRDVHAGQLADRGLVLEDRLQHALAHLRLVRRVGGQELAALHHGVDDRRHVVVVDARRRGTTAPAPSRRSAPRARRDAPNSSCSESAGSRSSARSKRTPAGMSRNSSSIDATPIVCEHLLAVVVGEGEKRVASLLGQRPACTPQRRAARRPRTGPRGGCGRASRRRTDPRSPSRARRPTAWLTSSTSPDSGAITSETALTDSTSPYDESFATCAPCVGRLEVDELAERVLREPGDPEHCLVAFDPRPVVLAVVLQVLGIRLRGSHSALPRVDRLLHDARARAASRGRRSSAPCPARPARSARSPCRCRRRASASASRT